MTAAVDDDRALNISVADTGVGIAGSDLQRVLEPFVQVEGHFGVASEGTGLGLALVRSLIELHGGTVELKSEPSVGTTVTVRFPTERGLDAGMSPK